MARGSFISNGKTGRAISIWARFKYNLFITKITHGTVTDGPFDYGETITGGTSAATGDVAWVDGDGEYIELINVSGTFQSGETLTGGTSAASATSTNVDTVSDVVVLDDATTPTTRYTLGTDYDVNVQDGMFGLYPGGSASTPVYVSADYEAVDTASIKAMTNDAVEGELKFVGTSDVGPRYTVYAWKVKLSPSGGFGLISEGVEPITIAVEILSDASNHPDYPYIKPIMRQAA